MLWLFLTSIFSFLSGECVLLLMTYLTLGRDDEDSGPVHGPVLIAPSPSIESSIGPVSVVLGGLEVVRPSLPTIYRQVMLKVNFGSL